MEKPNAKDQDDIGASLADDGAGDTLSAEANRLSAFDAFSDSIFYL